MEHLSLKPSCIFWSVSTKCKFSQKKKTNKTWRVIYTEPVHVSVSSSAEWTDGTGHGHRTTWLLTYAFSIPWSPEHSNLSGAKNTMDPHLGYTRGFIICTWGGREEKRGETNEKIESMTLKSLCTASWGKGRCINTEHRLIIKLRTCE